MKIGILASGVGSNAYAIINKIKAGVLDAEVEIILSNRANAPVLQMAAKEGIKAAAVERKDYPTRAAHDAAMAELLQQHGCEIIVLAGYMLVLGGKFLETFPNRVINIHPALLPSFPGTEGAANAQMYGVKITGVSVHFVEEKIDSGPLIIQAALPCKTSEPLEDLKQRIHALEHRIYPQALQWLAEERISLAGRQVILAPGGRDLAEPLPESLIWPPLEAGF